jgi:hypothetical protein
MHGSSVTSLMWASTGRVSPTTPSDRPYKFGRRYAPVHRLGPDIVAAAPSVLRVTPSSQALLEHQREEERSRVQPLPAVVFGVDD